FRKVLSRSRDERAAFLAHACAGRPELLAAVEALLAAHDQANAPCDAPPPEPGETVDSANVDANSPATSAHTPGGTVHYRPGVVPGFVIAGRYTLHQKLGAGGMGEVWVAQQFEPVKRRVAVKLVKAGMDSQAVLTRFEQERQALALMDHPNI